jgi:hypothetical protein
MDVLELTADAAQNPKWRKRADAFWRHQAERYGLVLHGYTLACDAANRLVYTHCLVQRVLPGVRLPPRLYAKTEAGKRSTGRAAA